MNTASLLSPLFTSLEKSNEIRNCLDIYKKAVQSEATPACPGEQVSTGQGGGSQILSVNVVSREGFSKLTGFM